MILPVLVMRAHCCCLPVNMATMMIATTTSVMLALTLSMTCSARPAMMLLIALVLLLMIRHALTRLTISHGAMLRMTNHGMMK